MKPKDILNGFETRLIEETPANFEGFTFSETLSLLKKSFMECIPQLKKITGREITPDDGFNEAVMQTIQNVENLFI